VVDQAAASSAGQMPIHPVRLGTFRVTEVLVTGCVWVAGGVIALFGALYLYTGHHPGIETLCVAVFGAVILLCGISYVLARIEVTRTSVTTYWGLHKKVYPIDPLIGVTVDQPRGHPVEWQPGTETSRMTFIGFVAAPWMLFYVIFHTLFRGGSRLFIWISIPGSVGAQVMHLIPRFGGAVPIRAISAYTKDNADMTAAVAAVAAVIGAYRAAHPLAIDSIPARTIDEAARRMGHNGGL
jgi:hypothetical protein